METDRPIIFFDGLCNLCNGFINNILKRDKKHIFYVASLQGKTAQKQLSENDLKKLSSVILKEGSKTYYKSSAVFRIAFKLGGIYWIIMPFWLVPRLFTNWIYDFVAIFRYKVFGKRNTCRLPSESERKQFLD